MSLVLAHLKEGIVDDDRIIIPSVGLGLAHLKEGRNAGFELDV